MLRSETMARALALTSLLAVAACTPKSSAQPDSPAIVDASSIVVVDASTVDASVPEVMDAAPPVIVTRKPTTPKAWLQGQGATVKSLGPLANVDSCVLAGVGSPSEAAILCASHREVDRGAGANATYRIVSHRTVSVVRNDAIVNVLDVVEGIQPLDPETDRDPRFLVLSLDLAPDGLSATVTDSAKAGCKPSASHLAIEKSLPTWWAIDNELVNAACAARGRYTWKGGTFVKEP